MRGRGEAFRLAAQHARNDRLVFFSPDGNEDPDDILITTGASQALAVACRAILRPGDVAACEDPSFTSVIRSMRDSGARVVGVPCDDDGLDIDALEALLSRQEIRLVAIQPHGDGIPILAIHVLGTNANYYRPLAQALGTRHPVWGLTVGLLTADTPTEVTELAELYLRRGPAMLFEHAIHQGSGYGIEASIVT